MLKKYFHRIKNYEKLRQSCLRFRAHSKKLEKELDENRDNVNRASRITRKKILINLERLANESFNELNDMMRSYNSKRRLRKDALTILQKLEELKGKVEAQEASSFRSYRENQKRIDKYNWVKDSIKMYRRRVLESPNLWLS